MALLICGVVLGFVLSSALFIQKIWSLQDKAEHYKFKAKFYMNECKEKNRQLAEWETVSECGAQDVSFRNW